MRRLPIESRSRVRRGLQAGRGVVLTVAAAALMVTAWAPAAPGQTDAAGKAAPTPRDARPLARYVPRDNLVAYLGSEGLDAQDEAWQKSAAHKILNETSLGELLETMTAQLAEKALSAAATRKINGPDVVTIVKHMAKAGFVASLNLQDAKTALGVVVVRGGAGREVRGAFSRLMGTAMGKTTFEKVKKAGRTVIVVPIFAPDPAAAAAAVAAVPADAAKAESRKAKEVKDSWSWWAEGTDLVVTLGKGTDDAVIATLDSKRPGALDHPARLELSRAEAGYLPIGQFFLDPAAIPETIQPPPSLVAYFTKLGVTRVDYRWGFQDDALLTVLSLKSPRPRRGPLALFDQPGFDKGKLPPLPDGLQAFTVVAVDLARSFDALMSMDLPPDAKARLDAQINTLKTKSRIDARKDLLAHLGPKMAVYVAPGPSAALAAAADKAGVKAAAPATPPARPAPALALPALAMGNPLAAIFGPGPAMPKLVFIAEVDDQVAFAKTIDNAILAINKAFRESADAADAAAAAAADAAAGKAASKSDDKESRPPPLFPEFKLTPLSNPSDRYYVLNIPSTLAKQYPAGFRPAVRLGNKHVVVSTTPDTARQALEFKAGAWTPSADLAPVLEALPSTLSALNLGDPRATLPETLATLPGSLQKFINTLIGLAPMMMTGGGMPPGAAAAAGAAPPMLVLKIPEEMLPKPDEIRARLFPAAFAVTADDQEIRFLNRSAFPNIMIPSGTSDLAAILPTILNARPVADPAQSGATPGAGPATPPKPARPGASSLIPPD